MSAVVAGERRIVTVLYADVVGSTAIGERLGPERSKILLDEVIRLIGDQVERFGGTVAQLAGDSVLALFGAPVANEDDSERAVRAALATQRSIGRYAHDVEAAYGVDLAVRIGLNTGPVVFGAETARRVDDTFELEPLGEQELRGKTSPVETFRVAGEREPCAPMPSLPLVGRDFELTVLERALSGLAEGRGVIVSVMGEPGIGKSRLLWEVRTRYRDRVRFIEGRAVSYAQSFPYNPI